jgi:hypothetical protein
MLDPDARSRYLIQILDLEAVSKDKTLFPKNPAPATYVVSLITETFCIERYTNEQAYLSLWMFRYREGFLRGRGIHFFPQARKPL